PEPKTGTRDFPSWRQALHLIRLMSRSVIRYSKFDEKTRFGGVFASSCESCQNHGPHVSQKAGAMQNLFRSVLLMWAGCCFILSAEELPSGPVGYFFENYSEDDSAERAVDRARVLRSGRELEIAAGDEVYPGDVVKT